MTVKITILGLGQIGTSIGLALGEHKELVSRIGNDIDPAIARRAEKMGAVDHIVYNLPSAVRQADIVILALPVDEIYEVLKIICQDLKEGAVVIDTSPSKATVSDWAKELLPPDRYFVAWTPTVNFTYLDKSEFGIDAAHADLFRDSLIFITTPSETNEQAIKLASDLTTLVGAKPFFADQAEVDGLVAANIILPQLVAAALINAVVDEPGWREGRKLAGQPFALSTSPVMTMEGKDNIAQSALANRENVVRVIDNFSRNLVFLRQAIQDDNREALQERVKQARESIQIWIQQRKSNNWLNVENPAPAMPTAGEVFGRLIGLRKPKSSSKK
jgi:prephenate dehydrogenase